jgi:predicted O-methyltransferase YrrM
METADRVISLDDLLAHVPAVHEQRRLTWGIDERLARYLAGALRPQHVTLETGAGLSTLVFLRAGVARHIAVSPEADEFAVIQAFAAANGISTRGFRPVVGGSQAVLPTLYTPPLDVVLIDGDHSFPAPFVDWHYTADRLAVGGLMIVDDIQIVTGAILADFMSADPKWALVQRMPERFAIFRKVAHPIADGAWVAQPYLFDSHPVGTVRVLARRPSLRDVARRVYARLPAPAKTVGRALWRVARWAGAPDSV